MQATYLSCADTAKLVRAALKRAFPGVKFSVRSETYSGGASIRVNWIDGPCEKAVTPVAKQFCGGSFDSMIDLKSSHTSWLMPDGSACVASDPGTLSSMGVHAPRRNWMPSPEAKLVHFGADFISCTRDYSAEMLTRVRDRLVAKGLSVEGVEIVTNAHGHSYPHATGDCEWRDRQDMEMAVSRAAQDTHCITPR